MLVTKKLNDLKHVGFSHKIRLLIFQLKKTLGLSYAHADYQLNALLTTHLLEYNGFLTDEDSFTYTADFYFDSKIKSSMTLRKLPSSDFAVFEQVFVLKEYGALVEVIKKHEPGLSRPLNVIDAGGNIGLTSIFLNTKFPGSQFGVIEPDDKNFKILERNIKQNNFTAATAIHAGVWNKDCFLKQHRDFRDGNDWSVTVVESEAPTALKGYSVKNVMQQLNFDCIDVLKIDIEGSEKQLFMDADAASEFLCKTKYIAIEIHDELDCREQINAVLTTNHFDYFLQDGLTIGVNRKLVN